VPGLILVGAGPGLGTSVARRFASERLGVSLVARSAVNLAQAEAVLAPYDVPVAGYPADAGRPDQLEPALASAVRDHGAPDVVVYNAAVIRADAPGDLTPDELAETWSVNVQGVLVTALATIPGMQQRGSGTFLVTGGLPRPLASHLSLSLGKAGARALTSMLAEHFGPHGVHVATVTVAGTVAPGTSYDPDLIAEQYWRLHRQPPDAWETEHRYDGAPTPY
jgi:NAD(P)-dependent dehydrogenase (short-subunit alcohol dehydrogenase family)